MNQLTRLPQLRIAVNSRCGRKCFYCRPSGEGLPTVGKQELTCDDVIRICRVSVALGVSEVKLTGGDPALWPPLIECVRRLKSDVQVPQVHVISRHPRIGELAEGLASAGVDLLNISLDTLNPDLHRDITGEDDLDLLISAIRECSALGVPCKLNMVVMQGINDGEIDSLIRFCEDARIRTLKLLDVIRDLETGTQSFASRLYRLRGRRPSETYMPLSDVIARLRLKATSVRTAYQGALGHPMTAIRLASGLEVVIKDHSAGAWYGADCKACPFFKCHDALMALRLTADARLQFCLLREDTAVDLKPYLDGADDQLWAVMHRALSVYDAASFHVGHEAGTVSELQDRLLPIVP